MAMSPSRSSIGFNIKLGSRIFLNNTRARYRCSLLGWVWAFLPAIVSGVFFIFLKFARVLPFEQTLIAYPLYVLIGTVLWQVFVDGLYAPFLVSQNARRMLQCYRFPYGALIFASFFDVLLVVLTKGAMLALVCTFFKVPWYEHMWLAFPPILLLLLMGLGWGLLLAPLAMLFTDFKQMVTLSIPFFFFLTPVVYNPPASALYQNVAMFNPISPLLMAGREALVTGIFLPTGAFFIVGGATLMILGVACWFYLRSIPIFVERLGA
jgi:lipopolysaccharide transport system permease protein